MHQSHVFNYCQHCGVTPAAIEQAVLPHASSPFLTLCIKAPTLANSAALQTPSSSQEEASAAIQLLARLLNKVPVARNTRSSPARWLYVTRGPSTGKGAANSSTSPRRSRIPTPNPSPAAWIICRLSEVTPAIQHVGRNQISAGEEHTSHVGKISSQ